MKLFVKIFDLYQKVSPSKQNAFHYFVITLPILFSFQNCGSQKFNSQMVDLSSNSSNILGVVPPICSPTQSRVCKENNGVGFQFCEADGSPKTCQIESCESGFTLKNGKCEPQSCKPTTTASCEGLNGSGVRTCNSDGLGFGACVLNKCSVGYELDVVTKICKPLACVPNTSLGCNIANGVGLQTCKSDGSGYLGCKLQSCDTGYKPSGDFCVASCTAGEKQNCSENNGSGARTCLSSGSGYGACQLNACNDGYNLQNSVCVANLCAPNTDSNCTAGNGSGKQQCNAQGTGYGACLLNACQMGYALVSGSCLPKICEANKASACSVENGTGEKMCNATGTGFGACEVKSCQDGYDYINALCTKKKKLIIATGLDSDTCVELNGFIQCYGGYVTDGLIGGDYENKKILSSEGVTQISIGHGHGCIIVNGSLQCWGWNWNGQVGDGTNNNVSIPKTIIPSGVTQVSLGMRNSCAIVNGSLQCWGSSNQAGISPISLTPKTIVSSGVTQISASGLSEFCALVNESIQCWYSLAYQPITVIANGVTQLSSGEGFSCAIANEALWCWGSILNHRYHNSFENKNVYYPRLVIEKGVKQVSVSNGYTSNGTYACAVVDDSLQCFGKNSFNQISTLNKNDITYNPVVVIKNGVTQVSAGANHVCAVINGGLKCWGDSAPRIYR